MSTPLDSDDFLARFGGDVVDFLDEYEEDIFELLETGSVTIMKDGVKYLLTFKVEES